MKDCIHNISREFNILNLGTMHSLLAMELTIPETPRYGLMTFHTEQ